jgi:hypothetical protein
MFFAITLLIVAYWFFRSPLASAIAESIRRNSPGHDPALEQAVARLTEDLGALREQVFELAERVDFTERALTDMRRRELSPHSRS